MPIIRPFQTRDHFFYPAEVRRSALAFALWIIDEFTQKPVEAQLTVKIKGEDKRKPIRNPSGYYCFVDLATGTYVVQIEAEGFFPFEEAVDMAALPRLNPVREVILQPNPAYAFPPNATLIRGMVKSSGQAANAAVTATASFLKKNPQTRTDANGEFALFLRKVELEKSPFPKKPDRIKDVAIQVRAADHKSASVSVYGVLPQLEFSEGTTANLKTIVLS
jgi:hypothetical protein